MESYTLPSFPREYSAIHITLFENVVNAPEIRKKLVAASITSGDEGDKLKAEVDYGFVEAELLVSKEHLLTAILTTLLYSFPSQTPSTAPIPSLETLSIDPTSRAPAASAAATTAAAAGASSTSSTQVGTPDNSGPTPKSTAAKPKTRTHNLHSELLLSLSSNNNISDAIRRHGMSDATTLLAVVLIGSPDESAQEVYRGIERVVRGKLRSWDGFEHQEKTDWSKVDKIYKLNELNALKSKLGSHQIVAKKRAAVVSSVAIKNVI